MNRDPVRAAAEAKLAEIMALVQKYGRAMANPDAWSAVDERQAVEAALREALRVPPQGDAPRRERVLRALEWLDDAGLRTNNPGGFAHCPWCNACRGDGHDLTCELAIALAASSPRPEAAPSDEPVRVPVEVSRRTDDEGTISFDAPGFTTVRPCRHCGVLMAGGPTACMACVRAGTYAPAPADAPATDADPEETRP